MRRRGSASIVANPILVGAVTTLVITVAVFLAYNANNGLPFVPTHSLFVDIKNGSEVVKGNEVREGGFRVGVVEDMVPVRLANGTVVAHIKLKLDKKIGALPVDTRAVIRQRGSLGLKYIEIDRGRATKALADGATLPENQTLTPVDLDRVYNMFDKKTRDGSVQNLDGFGDTFAGRGQDLNDFIQTAPRLFKLLAPVASNLADRQTQLPVFFQALERTVSTVAPVSKIYAGGFKKAADTFAAIDADPQALKETIRKNPATLDVSTRSLKVQVPFLQDTAQFSKDLNVAVQELHPTLPVVNSALEIGTPVTRRSVQLNTELQGAMVALRDLATAPTTNAALRGLTDTVTTLQPQLRFLGPYVTVCNNWNAFWTLAAEHLSSKVTTGTAERAMLNNTGAQDNSQGDMGAVLPAAGFGVRKQSDNDPQFLHVAAYGAAILPNGKADCEAGQQGYPTAGNSLTQFKDVNYRHVVADLNHTKDASGPHYQRFDINGKGIGLGPAGVPPGETYTDQPGGTGAQITKVP
jgi:phospholipid/cholesterol/gamma-HCH transport system substrate-binding protein